MSLKGAILAVVGADEAACERRAAPLRAAGAIVRNAIVQSNGLATLSTPGFDAAILEVGDEPEQFIGFVDAMRGDPRTKSMPVIALLSEALSSRLACLGGVYVVPANEEIQVAEAIAQLVTERRAIASAAGQARGLEERLRMALDRLSVMRSEAQAFTHDARVLCGIVVGFAANLRDGIAGPIDSAQRGHVAQILEAANDTAAMVERFGGAARAHTELPSDVGGPTPLGRRTSRRTLVDLAELARSTLLLFERVAHQKTITVELEATEPVSIWCDAMQVKQVVTNLLVNAIKFTPARGRVTVAVRSAAPPGIATGFAARHHAELIVRDTGPGIPADQRNRVFERGVRLARDEGVAGSGIGLAVVREIIATHGGTVRAEEAPGGGAALVVRLPLDMRTRREQSVLLVDDPVAAHRVVEALRGWGRDAFDAVCHEDGDLATALEACTAVIVVPSGPREEIDELIAQGAKSSAASVGGGGV